MKLIIVAALVASASAWTVPRVEVPAVSILSKSAVVTLVQFCSFNSDVHI
jgi:hypothetical protein